MAPKWTRLLLFPEPTHASSPMWDRPSTENPIFIESTPSKSPMWRASLRVTDAPIFPEAVPSPSPMWCREANGSPVCPCCMFGVPPPPPGVSVDAARPPTGVSSRPKTSTSSRPQTSGPSSPRSLKSMQSSMSIRLKKSFRNLRSRASGDSL